MSRFVCTLSCEKKESIYFLMNLILSLQMTIYIYLVEGIEAVEGSEAG